MKVDLTLIGTSGERELEVDVKDYPKSRESLIGHGIEIIQTKYFFKKDFYGAIYNKSLNRMIMCSVNERIILRAKNSGETLICEKIKDVEEISVN